MNQPIKNKGHEVDAILIEGELRIIVRKDYPSQDVYYITATEMSESNFSEVKRKKINTSRNPVYQSNYFLCENIKVTGSKNSLIAFFEVDEPVSMLINSLFRHGLIELIQ